ncbi:MAG TPA: nuclease [Blastocatellia bacterium]|nr:nuclease [Blastocatellia bacterium]HMV84652.1 nuclease [Blastocatellia bacterium]HMX29872.1 nuclease [Blastocatellia bacterium]HMY71046.1 nuclease [Blastocatellia bacterium]HMZ18736.1 nuclease [Blastocatellia bacterium]
MRTFIDPGVLTTAWRGQGTEQRRALAVLNDPRRQFVSSPFVQLEVLPSACYSRQPGEIEFYERFFAAVQLWVTDCEQIVADALDVACRFDLQPMEAVHLAAALLAGATEFITAAQPPSPFSRVTGIAVLSVRR